MVIEDPTYDNYYQKNKEIVIKELDDKRKLFTTENIHDKDD